MDVDPEDDNGEDAGALEDRLDQYDPREEDVDCHGARADKRRRTGHDKLADEEANDAGAPSNLHPDVGYIRGRGITEGLGPRVQGVGVRVVSCRPAP
jgi:hypothetical protein